MRLLQHARLAGRPASPPGAPKRGRRRWIWAIAALAGLGIVPASATSAAAAPPRPAPGLTPGAVYVSPAENDVFYTATDRTVWVKNLANGALARVGNGLLASGPSAIYDGSTVVVFGEGTDHKLWRAVRQGTGGYGNWELLGGAITAQPAAVAAPLRPGYLVFVRGADGAVYQASGTSSTHGTASFTRVGGRVLAGTGPAAAYERIGAAARGQAMPRPPASESTSVAVVGTDRALYVTAIGYFPISGQWQPAGGQTTASPALTLYQANGSLLAVVRGTSNAAYYRSVRSAGGWTSIGGRLNSGLVATIDGRTGTAYVYALGTDNQVYQKTANLAASPPAFSPTWKKVTS